MKTKIGYRKGMSNLPLFLAYDQMDLNECDVELIEYNTPEEQIYV